MKKLFLVLFLLAAPLLAGASQFKTGEDFTLGRSDVINENLYAAGGNLNIEGTVNGDLIGAGGSIYIPGTVIQDAAVAGGNILITGTVRGDLRVAGGNVTIEGNVGGDVVAAGGKINIMPSASIGGDLRAAGGQIKNEGKVAGAVHLRTSPPERERKERPFSFMGWLIPTVMSLILGWVLFYFFSRHAREVLETSKKSFWSEVLRGLIILIVFPVASVILMVTFIGLPVGIISLLLFAVSVMISYGLSGMILGEYAVRTFPRLSIPSLSWQSALGGILTLRIIGAIPIIGWVITGIFFLAALGSFLNYSYQSLRTK